MEIGLEIRAEDSDAMVILGLAIQTDDHVVPVFALRHLLLSNGISRVKEPDVERYLQVQLTGR
jgi:hypothetical protein